MNSNSSKKIKKQEVSKPNKNKKSKRKKSKSKSSSKSSRSARRQLPIFNKFCRIFEHKSSKEKRSKTKKNIRSKTIKISSPPVCQPKSETEQINVNEYSLTPIAQPNLLNLHKATKSENSSASASNAISSTTEEVSDTRNSATIGKEDTSSSLCSRTTLSSAISSSDSKSETKPNSRVESTEITVSENVPESSVEVTWTEPPSKCRTSKVQTHDDSSPFGPQQEVELTSVSRSENLTLNHSDYLSTENADKSETREEIDLPAESLKEARLPALSKQPLSIRSKSLIMMLVKTLKADHEGLLEVDEKTTSNTAFNRQLCLYRQSDPTPIEEDKNRHLYPTRTSSKSMKIGFLEP